MSRNEGTGNGEGGTLCEMLWGMPQGWLRRKLWFGECLKERL